MKKELLVLAILIGSCAGACEGHLSAPVDAGDCEHVEQLLIDADERAGAAEDKLYDLEMGDGCAVDLEPINDVALDDSGTGFVSNQYSVEYVQSLIAQIDEQYRINRVLSEQLDGVQNEYRYCNIDRAHIVTQYFAVLDGAATVPCVIDGRDAYCVGVQR